MSSPNPTNRRQFIRQASLISLGFVALSRCSNEATPTASETIGLPLRPDSEGYLDLPEGFTYRVISKAGDPMDDGFLVPGRADGMGVFPGPDGKIIIVRNHENSPSPLVHSPFGPDNAMLDQLSPEQLYDYGYGKTPSLGGTTTLVYNETTGAVEKQFLSLAGTNRNCAGGITPWGSWLTCEEDVTLTGEVAEKNHGYVFEVPASTEIGITPPQPIKQMGRFNHEAVAVDPASGIVYLTEDSGDSLFYRYLPDVPGQLAAGGKLQALMVIDQPGFDTRNWEGQELKVGEPLSVAWIDMEDVTSPKDDLRLRGYSAGAARFARGEGIWYGDGEFYMACTNGGPEQYGQVFRYRPSPVEGQEGENDRPGQLELFAESPDKTVLHMCDNLTISPWGHVILCEDNGERNHIKGINKDGQVYTIGLNSGSNSEFAGVVFSPSGKTLFVNIQVSGDTLAITGDWDALAKTV